MTETEILSKVIVGEENPIGCEGDGDVVSLDSQAMFYFHEKVTKFKVTLRLTRIGSVNAFYSGLWNMKFEFGTTGSFHVFIMVEEFCCSKDIGDHILDGHFGFTNLVTKQRPGLCFLLQGALQNILGAGRSVMEPNFKLDLVQTAKGLEYVIGSPSKLMDTVCDAIR